MLLQLGGTLLACGIGCTWAAGLSSWPGRPPGPAGHAPAPGPTLCSRGSTCALCAYLVDAATYYGNLVLLRCYGYGRALASFGVPMRGDCAFAACFHRQPTAAAVSGPDVAYLRLRHAVAPNPARARSRDAAAAGQSAAARGRTASLEEPGTRASSALHAPSTADSMTTTTARDPATIPAQGFCDGILGCSDRLRLRFMQRNESWSIETRKPGFVSPPQSQAGCRLVQTVSAGNAG